MNKRLKILLREANQPALGWVKYSLTPIRDKSRNHQKKVVSCL